MVTVILGIQSACELAVGVVGVTLFLGARGGEEYVLVGGGGSEPRSSEDEGAGPGRGGKGEEKRARTGTAPLRSHPPVDAVAVAVEASLLEQGRHPGSVVYARALFQPTNIDRAVAVR